MQVVTVELCASRIFPAVNPAAARPLVANTTKKTIARVRMTALHSPFTMIAGCMRGRNTISTSTTQQSSAGDAVSRRIREVAAPMELKLALRPS